jgi:formamidopyrimidine-DNA glycosylase
VLAEWTTRLLDQAGEKWPTKVTAFHSKMAVHGKFGEPCPVCGAPVQRIVYAENETNYCATCQTEGRLLADRARSKFLKDARPRRIEDL